jgi:small subunit ribosomal protein S1
VINNKDEIDKILEELIGKEIEVRIIDINPRTNKLIVSEKAATEVSTKELVQNCKVDQIIEGVVSGVADFGVFVRFTDNPALEGLIHISELGYRIVENPKEVVKIDDAVRAKITDIRDGKISLSLRALRPDPWVRVGEKYKDGHEVSGTVHSFHPFGAIVNLDGEIQGQVHVASFGSVEEMKKQLALGKEYNFIIESLIPGERKILLKLK